MKKSFVIPLTTGLKVEQVYDAAHSEVTIIV